MSKTADAFELHALADCDEKIDFHELFYRIIRLLGSELHVPATPLFNVASSTRTSQVDEVSSLLAKCMRIVVNASRRRVDRLLVWRQLAAGVREEDAKDLVRHTADLASMVGMLQSVVDLNDHVLALKREQEMDEDGLTVDELTTATQLCDVLRHVLVASRRLEAPLTPSMPVALCSILDVIGKLEQVVVVHRATIIQFAGKLSAEISAKFGNALTKPSLMTMAAKLSPYHCCDFEHVSEAENHAIALGTVERLVELSMLLVPSVTNGFIVDGEYGEPIDARRACRDEIVLALSAIKLIFASVTRNRNFSRNHMDGQLELAFWKAVDSGRWSDIGVACASNSALRDQLQHFWRKYGVLINAIISVQATASPSQRVLHEAFAPLNGDPANADLAVVAVRLLHLSRRSEQHDFVVELARRLM